MSLLEPILPTLLSVRRLPAADPAVLAAYGADPTRHTSLGLVTCDQDDALYVALDEATKHAAVDVVFARSFYAGAAHASGRLSGEILGVLAAAEPQSIEDGLAALTACLTHDACFYDADGRRGVTVFPHVIGSLGHYLAREAACRSARPWPTWWRRRSRPRSASTPRSRPLTSARSSW
jgi:ethanolamine utilization protein EutL